MEKFTYQEMYNDERDFWWYVARRKILNSVINSLNLKSANVLEVGSGSGGNVALLSQYGDYLGIEKELTAIELSRTRHPNKNFMCLSVPEDLQQVDTQFSLIAMLDVIEHIEDGASTMQKISGLLSENGKIILTTPAFPFLWSAHDDVHHHFRRYTKKQLMKLVHEAGFNVEYHSFFNFFLFPVAVAVKVMSKIFRSKKPHRTKISKLLNVILEKIFSLESKLIPKVSLPFGVSHLMVLSKSKKI